MTFFCIAGVPLDASGCRHSHLEPEYRLAQARGHGLWSTAILLYVSIVCRLIGFISVIHVIHSTHYRPWRDGRLTIECCISRRSKTEKLNVINYKHETNALAYTYRAGSWQI